MNDYPNGVRDTRSGQARDTGGLGLYVHTGDVTCPDCLRGAAHEERGLDVGRLARVLRYIHGDNVPFPMSRTPEEYAAFIVACDARLATPEAAPDE